MHEQKRDDVDGLRVSVLKRTLSPVMMPNVFGARDFTTREPWNAIELYSYFLRLSRSKLQFVIRYAYTYWQYKPASTVISLIYFYSATVCARITTLRNIRDQEYAIESTFCGLLI